MRKRVSGPHMMTRYTMDESVNVANELIDFCNKKGIDLYFYSYKADSVYSDFMDTHGFPHLDFNVNLDRSHRGKLTNHINVNGHQLVADSLIRRLENQIIPTSHLKQILK